MKIKCSNTNCALLSSCWWWFIRKPHDSLWSMSFSDMEPVILFTQKKMTILPSILMVNTLTDNWLQMARKCITFLVKLSTNNITWSSLETLNIKKLTINQNSTLRVLMSTEPFKVYNLKWWVFLKNLIPLSSPKIWLSTVNHNGVLTTKTSKLKLVISIF